MTAVVSWKERGRLVPPLGSAFPLPRPRVHGVVVPLLTAAHDEHHQAEEEHQQSPAQVEVDSEGAIIQGAVARDQAEDGHDAADDEEDEAERDADVETHGSSG